MKISSIAIENYRGIKDRQIIPIGNFTSIVGKNDSGKSIVVHAVATFLDSKTYKLTDYDFNDVDKNIIFEFSFIDENLKEIITTTLKSKFKKDDGLEEFINDIIIDNKIYIQKIFNTTSTTPTINFLIRVYKDKDFSNVYSKSDDELAQIISKYSIKVPISGSGRNSKLEKIKHIKDYCTKHGIEQVSIWSVDDYKISSLLPSVELFESDYTLEAGTSFKTKSVSEIKSFFENETSDNSKRLSQVRKDMENEMSREAHNIKNIMTDYTSSLEEIIISPEINWEKAVEGVQVKFKFIDDDRPIPMCNKGAGYRRLFMVARFRYLAEKNKGSNVIYLIEEPETFLHPSAQEDLLDAINKLSEENQIIITTHSPIFAGFTDVNSIILCKKEKQSLYKYVEQGSEQDFIFNIVDELGIKPRHNFRDDFEKIIFVEGPDDIEFYNLVSSNLLSYDLSSSQDILMLPCGGSTINSFVNRDYFSRQGREMFMILDSDKAGKQNEIDRQIKISEEFKKRKNCKSYILKKSSIENYLHPRAVERYLRLTKGDISDFKDTDRMKKKFEEINKKYSKSLGKPNALNIFRIMTKTEFEEVVENELLEFIREIIK